LGGLFPSISQAEAKSCLDPIDCKILTADTSQFLSWEKEKRYCDVIPNLMRLRNYCHMELDCILPHDVCDRYHADTPFN
jgi:hypothetical protein